MEAESEAAVIGFYRSNCSILPVRADEESGLISADATVKLIAGILLVIVIVIIIMRRKKDKKSEEDDF